MMNDADPSETLLAGLGDADPQKRAASAIQLATVRDERLIPLLMELLSDADATVRTNALTGLGLNRAAVAVPLILPLLHDPQDIVRERAITALAQIGTPDVIEPIITRLEDTSGWVRNRAAYVLGASGDGRAIDPLLELLDSPVAATVGVVAWALGQLRARQAVPSLRKLLSASDATVRGNAAWALGEMADPALLAPLLACLTDPEPDVRGKAAWALGNLSEVLADTSAASALIRLLEDFTPVADRSAHTFVAQYAAEALLQLGTDHARQAVDEWRPRAQQQLAPYRVREMMNGLAHPDAQMREDAAQALIVAGAEATDQLLEGLSHRNARVRQGSARVLGETGTVAAVENLLLALADSDVGVWSQATAALARLPASVPVLTMTLDHTPLPRVRLGVALALWRLERSAAAFPWLLVALRDPEFVVQASAITSLWKQPDERALATLQTLLTPHDTMMNRYIVQALQSIGTPHALGTIQHWWTETFEA